MGLYAEFKLFNLRHLANRIKTIKETQEKSAEQLEQVLDQIFSDQLVEQDLINKRIKKKYTPYDPKKKSNKAKEFIDDGKISDWRILIDDMKPCFHVATLNIKAFEMFNEFAADLDLDECWTDEEEFEDLVYKRSVFKSDMQMS